MKKLISLVLFLSIMVSVLNPLSHIVKAASYEHAWFPAPQMNLTQLAYESYSHGAQNAIDFAPGGNVYAPFSGTITYVDSRWGYVVLQSSDKVYYADGTLDYMTVAFMHDESVGDLYKGKTLSQGTPFYQAGGMGSGNPNAYADHVHLSVHKGKSTAITSAGKYGAGDVYAYNAFFINKAYTTKIVNKGVMASGNYMTNGAPSNWNNLWKNLEDFAEISITFNANGGSCSTSQKTIAPGSSVGTLPTPTRSGYDFAGWYYDKAASYDNPVTSSWTFSTSTTLYAHWANRLFTGIKITFDAQGGQLPGAKASRSIDGFNIGRGGNQLIVYNCSGNTVNTNSYGVEVAVGADGKVTAKRGYGDTSVLTVPSEGFILSGHIDSSGSGGDFVGAIEIGDYVAYNKSENKAYVYSSKNAYLANQRYVLSGGIYGELPTPTNGSKAFQGWYTATSGGTKITSSSTYSASTLYARWDCDHSYSAGYIPGNCVQYASVKYTCTKCGHSYTEYSTGEYSEWSTSYPTGIDSSLVQSKTQYRYSDYETKTSYETSLSGWSQLSSEWVKSGSGNIKYVSSWPSGFNKSHSLYSTYNKSPKSNSETSTTKTTVSTSTCGYIYYHWCRGTYTGGPINRKTSPTSSGEFNSFHAFYSTTAPSSLGSAASDGSYVYANGSCCLDSHWYYPVTVSSQDYTTYNKLFTYYRWTSWSSWSDSTYSASGTRKVETRKLYRYSVAPIGEHSWNDGTITKQATCTEEGVRTYTCSVCGGTRTATVAKSDHKYNSGTITQQPSCTAEGIRTYTCTDCGKTKTEAVSPLGHNHINGYCTRCGATDPTYVFTTASVTIGNASAGENETVILPVQISDNTGVAGFTFLIQHDEGITLTEIRAGDLLSQGVFEANIETGKVTWFNSKNIKDNGMLLNLVFQTNRTAGDFKVTMELNNGLLSNFVDENSVEKPVRFNSGILTVEAHIHTYIDELIKPTCTSDGYTIHTCACGDNYIDSYIPATGHFYSYVDSGEMHDAVCNICSNNITEEHVYNDGACICGKVEVVLPTTDETIVINHSLNLASDISVNYVIRADLLSDYDSFRLEVQIPVYSGNQEIDSYVVTLSPVLNGSYYYFTLTDITALQMNDCLTAVLYMNKGDRVYTSLTDSYSIATYAYNQLNKASATKELKTLCADLLRYGTEAQKFKSYRTDTEATAAMTSEHKSFLSNLNAVSFGNTNTVFNDINNPIITWAGKTLNLESKVVVKFIFNAGVYTGDISKLTLRVLYRDNNGVYQSVTLFNPSIYNENNRQYSFDFDGLMAAELRTTISIAIYNGDKQLSQTLQYSPDTYGNNKTGALGNLCKALFAYSDSAKRYFS